MLGDGDQNRLMIRGRIDGGEPVGTGLESSVNTGSEDTIRSSTIQSFEEGKAGGVSWVGLLQRVEEFNDNMGMAPDDTLAIQLLWCGEVVLLRVYEITSLKISDGHLDGEWGVGCNPSTVGWEHELRRGHNVHRGDDTHRGWVAGSSTDLLSISDRKVGNSKAKVDEVVS